MSTASETSDSSVLDFPSADSTFFKANTYHITPDVCLTPFLNTDVLALVHIHATSPNIERFTNNTQNPYTVTDAVEFLLRAQRDLIHEPTGTCLKFAIRDSRTMKLVGLLGVFRSWKYGPGDERWWSLGYALAEAWTRRGIVTACVRCVMEQVGRKLGARWWECQAMVGNLASRKVLEKCGFVLVEEVEGGMEKRVRGPDGKIRVERIDAWFFEKKE
ncbi:acyl-CoA N-acyltransferase [Jimgerdemannia flammicorona]|uniref:Acyl-CoA N-acyltransferase n=1 Tax=Jimgerdemannia flammicorona TaxID=994334 RepID=A0A433Q7S5_9FUNG|nr:acyl-CoA N-acyltransferase [Jimgerdemannia flammicorona]